MNEFVVSAEEWRRLVESVDRIRETLYEVKTQLSLQCERTDQMLVKIESTLDGHAKRIDSLETWRRRREVEIARLEQEQRDHVRSVKYGAAILSGVWIVFAALHEHVMSWFRLHFGRG